jgi:GntR family transcriptional repressor for pyruvate dehydrogenase complex
MLEIHLAGVAALAASKNDVAAMEHWIDAQAASGDDVEAAAQCDLEFHRAIARTTGNELYLVLLDSIRGALLDIRRTLMVGRLERTVREHRNVVSCIAAGDALGARQAMQIHLDKVRDDWQDQRHIATEGKKR